MTPDDPRPASPDDPGTSVDELASALVDGELDPETAAAVRARPDVAARAAELAAARDALRAADVPPPDPVAREQAIAAALAAVDEEGGATATPAPTVGPAASPATEPAPAPPTPLDARRQAHAARRRRTWQLAAAAAVLVLAGVLGVAIGTSDDSGDDDTAASSVGPGDGERTTVDAAEEAPPAAADEELDAEAGSASPDAPAGRFEVGDLGTFASADDLADHVARTVPGGDLQILPEAGDGPGAAPETAQACGAPPPPLDDPSTPARLHGHAVVDGTPVDVWLVDDGGRSRLVAVDRDCRVVVDRLLP